MHTKRSINEKFETFPLESHIVEYMSTKIILKNLHCANLSSKNDVYSLLILDKKIQIQINMLILNKSE